MTRRQVAPDLDKKIVITGAAGLVGLNLALLLREAGYTNVVGIDKKSANLQHFQELLPDYKAINAGLESPGNWEQEFNGAELAILFTPRSAVPTTDRFTRTMSLPQRTSCMLANKAP